MLYAGVRSVSINAFLLVLGVRGVLGRSGGLPGGSWSGGRKEKREREREKDREIRKRKGEKGVN